MYLEGIKFKGKFREYQQRVLDNSEKYLLDGKINIVAAPGSGKTILGLELIRRIGGKAIIFSPTITIKEQWKKRFEDSFSFSGSDVNEYVSLDLYDIKLINSVTYQALYSIMNKIEVEEDGESIDYSSLDLFNLIKENEIKTICLDEAHHLQNEWQKALEKFIKGLDKDIKIISLTATPPYDSKPSEWERYISVCGEIDDEIFVPELVKEKTLCPHQDYILFNYPTKDEIDSFKDHREKSQIAINEISKLEFIWDLNDKLNYLYKNKTEYTYSNFKYIVALYIFLNYAMVKINKSIFYKLTNSRNVPSLNLLYAERAISFMLEDEELLTEEEKDKVKRILKQYSMLNRNKVRLDLSDKLKRSLVTSCGKLNSISEIVDLEYESLTDELRMLILTDYIKKEEVVNIGKDEVINNISIVSIFETLRKNNSNIQIGCLSGSLTILPIDMEKILTQVYKIDSNQFKIEILNNTSYAKYVFKGNNKIKVDVVSKLFEDGYLKVLIGTQALLGEGWDSPCINSLVLASYVGSFMLSNQMRGRAIRTFKEKPDKTANIWHLVTIEPEYVFENDLFKKIGNFIFEDKNEIKSNDFDTLIRRFDCFVGPNYDTGEIESGINRISYIKPPYDKSSFQVINLKTKELAKNRENMRKSWDSALEKNAKTIIENQIPKELKIPAFTFQNIMILMLVSSLMSSSIVVVTNIIKNGIYNNFSLVMIISLISFSIFLINKMYKLIEFLCKHFSPSKSFIAIGRAILDTLKDLNLVHDGAVINVDEDPYKIFTCISIKNASIHEQNIFNQALKELLSPMDNPKYIIIKKNVIGRYDYKYSFACPIVLSKNTETVDLFKSNLKKIIGEMDIKYAYNETGRKLYVLCRRKSFIIKNDKKINKRQRVTRFD